MSQDGDDFAPPSTTPGAPDRQCDLIQQLIGQIEDMIEGFIESNPDFVLGSAIAATAFVTGWMTELAVHRGLPPELLQDVIKNSVMRGREDFHDQRQSVGKIYS